MNFLKILIKNLKLNFKNNRKIEINMLLNAKVLQDINNRNIELILNDICAAEFKVFSQHGDDGIISFLVEYLEIKNCTFIEFGVENYTESNTRYLLIDKYWKGLIIDGSKKNVDYIKNDDIYWKFDLKAVDKFIDIENINQIFIDNGFQNEIGLLHIDIDGNDYWVWKHITSIQPIIVIMEYNSLFGSEESWTIPYEPNFFRTHSHYSNLYYGASLKSLINLGIEKGYIFIGCNKAGNNAYFIKKGFEKRLKELSINEGFKSSSFRESRDKNGNLNYLSKIEQYNLIKGLPIFDTETKINTKIL